MAAANAIRYLSEREEIGTTTQTTTISALSLRLLRSRRKPGNVTAAGTIGNTTHVIELAVNDVTSLPRWIEPTLAGALRLLFLAPNWDFQGGRPIEKASIGAALQSLSILMDDRGSIPQWVPTSEGGVQLEWHESNVDLEMEFSSDGTAGYVVFSDLNDRRRDWDGTVSENVGRLKQMFETRLHQAK
jgi:hypothetical protein